MSVEWDQARQEKPEPPVPALVPGWALQYQPLLAALAFLGWRSQLTLSDGRRLVVRSHHRGHYLTVTNDDNALPSRLTQAKNWIVEITRPDKPHHREVIYDSATGVQIHNGPALYPLVQHLAALVRAFPDSFPPAHRVLGLVSLVSAAPHASRTDLGPSEPMALATARYGDACTELEASGAVRLWSCAHHGSGPASVWDVQGDVCVLRVTEPQHDPHRRLRHVVTASH